MGLSSYTDTELMLTFCESYFASRHGIGLMPRARLEYVLASEWITDVVKYRLDDKVIAYVWLGRDTAATHFYYSFYDLKYVQRSLGLWLMIDVALDSKELGHKYLYLGTAYGCKGKYKTNFDDLEWWDGREWLRDREALRALCEQDELNVLSQTDLWKETLQSF